MTKTTDLAKHQLDDIMKRKGYYNVKNVRPTGSYCTSKTHATLVVKE